MSERFRPTGREVITGLERLGFSLVRITGSHHRMKHADGRVTSVPIHSGETIGPGLQSKICRDCEINNQALRKAVRVEA